MDASEQKWIGSGEAASILGISVATLRRWSDRGDVPHWKTPSGRRLYSAEELKEWLLQRRDFGD